MREHWIAVDWGTTNFRAFLIKNNQVIESVSCPTGLLQINNKDFSGVLKNNIQPWLDAYADPIILMAGMVGSQQGWKEAPYVALPCDGKSLAQHAIKIDLPWARGCWIISGVSGLSSFHLPDVMRGEEVQLIGLSVQYPQENQTVILPGTHSKHVELENGIIQAFSTFMTGEIYSLLLNHSLLGKDLPPQKQNDEAFILGVKNTQKNTPLTHLLFSARTLRLNQTITIDAIADYLSGLLIGYELHYLNKQEVWAIGNEALLTRYQLAATLTSTTLHPVCGDNCFISGMTRLKEYLLEQ